MSFIINISFLFFFLIQITILTAQITIDGTITDSDSNPISDALVEIIDQDDSTNYYSSTTNESGYFSITNIFTDIEERKDMIPSDFIVLRNYPNPFNPSTIIYYELSKSENVEIRIYDILGREIRTLYKKFHKSGIYTLHWDGRNNWNSPVTAGVYFCRLKTKDQFKVHKMLLLDGGSYSHNKSSITLKEERSNKLSKANGVLYYSVIVTGNDILESEFKHLSCSSDTTLNLLVPKILQTAIIGPEGGKLETEEFSLTVPEGAFSQNIALNLAIEPDSNLIEEEALSNLFIVRGLPDSYQKVLKLKIKLTKTTSDSLSIGIGEHVKSYNNGFTFIFYSTYSADDSSGYILLDLPPNTLNLLKTNSTFSMESDALKYFLGLISPEKVNSSDGNFIFEFNKDHTVHMSDFDSEITNIFNDYIQLGFSKEQKYYGKKGLWPIPIKIRDYYKYDRFEWNTFQQPIDLLIKNEFDIRFSLHDDYPAYKLDNLRSDFGPLLYRLFSLQDYWFILTKPYHYYFHEAMKIWFIDYFNQDGYSIHPSVYNIFNKLHLLGTQNGSSSSLVPLLKYLSMNTAYGNNILSKLYYNLENETSALKSIVNSISEPENIWWPGFFKEFIQGNIYNVPSDEILKIISETIEFNDGDTLKYVDERYSDLSAKLFRININSEEIKNNRSLRFKIDLKITNLDYVKTLVFGLLDSRLIYLSEGIDFSIGNLFEYSALIVCVVNSGNEPHFTGTSEIHLDIRVTDDLPFRQCQIKIGLPAEFKFENADSSYTNFWSPRWQAKGNFKENTFTGKIDKDFHGENTTGSMKVIIDLETKVVTHFEASATTIDSWGTSNWSILGNNMPLKLYMPDITLEHFSKGEDACPRIHNVDYFAIPNEGDREDLIRPICDTTWTISIDFDIE